MFQDIPLVLCWYSGVFRCFTTISGPLFQGVPLFYCSGVPGFIVCCFNVIDRDIEMLKKSLIFKNFNFKWNIVKHFARHKKWAALRKLFSLLPTQPSSDKIFLRLQNKYFYKEIYRNIQTFAFKVLQECSSWASRNGAVQISFLTLHKNMSAGKFVKSERFLAVLQEHIIFNVKWVEVRKMSEVFWAKLYCKKIVTCFASFCFCWFWDRTSEIKKKLWWCPLEHLDKYKNAVSPK